MLFTYIFNIRYYIHHCTLIFNTQLILLLLKFMSHITSCIVFRNRYFFTSKTVQNRHYFPCFRKFHQQEMCKENIYLILKMFRVRKMKTFKKSIICKFILILLSYSFVSCNISVLILEDLFTITMTNKAQILQNMSVGRDNGIYDTKYHLQEVF